MRTLRTVVVTAFLASLMGIPHQAHSQTVVVAVAQQTYASNLLLDPHDGDDENIYVSAGGGMVTSQAYMRLDFGGLPESTSVRDLRVTVVPGNVVTNNVGTPTLSACPLAEALKPEYDPSSDAKPAYDCLRAQADAELGEDGAWTFQLDALAQSWSRFGNTGFAIIPTPDPTSPTPGAPPATAQWDVGLTKSASAASTNLVRASSPSAPVSSQNRERIPATSLFSAPVAPPIFSIPETVPGDAIEEPQALTEATHFTQEVLVISIKWMLIALAALAGVAGVLATGAITGPNRDGSLVSRLGTGARAAYSRRAELIGLLLLIALVTAGLIGRVVIENALIPQ